MASIIGSWTEPTLSEIDKNVKEEIKLEIKEESQSDQPEDLNKKTDVEEKKPEGIQVEDTKEEVDLKIQPCDISDGSNSRTDSDPVSNVCY